MEVVTLDLCRKCAFYDDDVDGDGNILEYCLIFNEYITEDICCYSICPMSSSNLIIESINNNLEV